MAHSESPTQQQNLTAPSIKHPVVTIHYGPATIKAPADFVFETLSDVSTWPKWNPLVPKCDILSRPNDQESSSVRSTSIPKLSPGDILRFHVANMGVPVRMTYEVSKVLIPKDTHPLGQRPAKSKAMYVINWKNAPLAHSRTPAWIIRFERTHEIRIVDEASAEVETWDCQAGPAAYMVRWLFSRRLNKGFKGWVEGLKEFCEETWRKP